jgi:hypothetical protein
LIDFTSFTPSRYGSATMAELFRVSLVFLAICLSQLLVWTEVDCALQTTKNHTFVLVLCPTDNGEKRQIIGTTWFNVPYLPPHVISYRFISDNITNGDILAGDTIRTHPEDTLQSSAKVRTSLRYVLELAHVSYVLWLDDDTIPNLSRFLSIVLDYDRDTTKADARRLYMGVPIKNMADNPHPVYMHGSAILFGSEAFKSLGGVDRHMGLRFFGNGDTAFGIWPHGFHSDVRQFRGTFVIDADPIKINASLAHGNLHDFCEPLYYHNVKNAADLSTFGFAVAEKCSRTMFEDNGELRNQIEDISKKFDVYSHDANDKPNK